MEASSRTNDDSIQPQQPHHRFVGFCTSRAKYRQGNRDTAVKVYSISSESVHLLIQGVPSTPELSVELRAAFEVHGVIKDVERLGDYYPRETFTDVFRIRFEKLMSSRSAKRKMDNTDFYGGQLHVCYAPEYESVAETRAKLAFRRQWVSSTLWKLRTAGSSRGNGCLRAPEHASDVPSTSSLIAGPSCSTTGRQLSSNLPHPRVETVASHRPAVEAIVQAQWQRRRPNTDGFPASTSSTTIARKRAADDSEPPCELPAPKKPSTAPSTCIQPTQSSLDIRPLTHTKHDRLRLVPRSVTTRTSTTNGKSSSKKIVVDIDKNQERSSPIGHTESN